MADESLVEPAGEAVTEQQLGSMSAFQKTLQQASAMMSDKPEQSAAPASATTQMRETIRKAADAPVPDGDITPKPAAAAKSRVPEFSEEQAKPQGRVDSMDSINQAAAKARGKKRSDYNAAIDAERAEAAKPKEEAAAPEKKEAPVESEKKETSATTAATTAKADAGQPVTMQEIDAALADPNISKRHRERMQFLANEAKKATELDGKVKELTDKLSKAKSDDEVKKITERLETTEKQLMQYRRRVEASEDPEIKTKFDSVITAANSAIDTKLKEVGIGDKMRETIAKMGGFDAFARSSVLFNVPTEDGKTQQMTAAQLAKAWLDGINVGDSEFIRAKMQEKMNTSEARAREIKRMGDEAETYFKTQREQQEKAQKEQQDHMTKLRTEYDSFRDKWISGQPWLKDKEIPANASAETRAEIEKHNKENALVRQLWEVAANPGSVEDYGQLVGRAAASVQLQRDLAEAQKRIAELEASNKKLQGGVRTTPTGKTVSIATPAAKKEKTSEDVLRGPSAAQNIMAAAERMMRGGGTTEAEE
jgi:hypothetical protein